MENKNSMEDKLNWLVENEKGKEKRKEMNEKIHLKFLEQKMDNKLLAFVEKQIYEMDLTKWMIKQNRKDFLITIGTFFFGLLIPILFNKCLIAYEIFGIILLLIIIIKIMKENKKILKIDKAREGLCSKQKEHLK